MTKFQAQKAVTLYCILHTASASRQTVIFTIISILFSKMPSILQPLLCQKLLYA